MRTINTIPIKRQVDRLAAEVGLSFPEGEEFLFEHVIGLFAEDDAQPVAELFGSPRSEKTEGRLVHPHDLYLAGQGQDFLRVLSEVAPQIFDATLSETIQTALDV
ncbi:MAG: hypothetical protein MZV70_00720 [Desulfobacterales bacterium]|nr:hypothetical protein [Desulfobacterales bacterium]